MINISLQCSKEHILIGNGINRAFNDTFKTDTKRFVYEEIVKQMAVKCNPVTLKIIKEFNKIYTDEYDFEKILRFLKDYCISNSIKDKHSELEKDLKQKFVEALSEMHLFLSKDLSIFNSELNVFTGNIKMFEKVYTINFDLKLYYLMRIKNLFGDFQLDYKNGFNDLFCEPPKCKMPFKCRSFSQTYFHDTPWRYLYLHGATHLFEMDSKTYKMNSDGNWHLSLKVKDIGCLLVIDGYSEGKLKQIEANTYLKEVYNSLLSLEGSIYIYGCSMDDNDSHLWSQIDCAKNINNIYIGMSDLNNIDEKMRIKELFTSKRPYIFDHIQANIWTNEKFIEHIKNNSQQL